MRKWLSGLTLVVSSLAVQACTCGLAQAQIQQPLALQESAPFSNYVTEVQPSTGYEIAAESLVTHDDNIFGTNGDRHGDTIFQEGAVLDWFALQPRWDFAVDYQPTLLLYQSEGSLNGVNQNLSLQGGYKVTPHLEARLTDNLVDRTQNLGPGANQDVSLPSGPPPTLNSTLLTPLSRELSNQSEGDLSYDASHRASFDLMGSYAIQNFSGVGNSDPTLFDTRTAAGGVSYQYRYNEHVTIGTRYLYQDFQYGGQTTNEVHTVFLTAVWAVRPHITLSVFAGPQYSILSGPLPNVLPTGPGTPASNTWLPAGGGTLSMRTERTVLNLTAERLVNNGGGLLTSVTNSYEGAELRRRVFGDWDLVLAGSNTQSVELLTATQKGRVNGQVAEAAVEHPVWGKFSIHLEYDFLRQRVNQFVPLGTNVNTNQFTAGLLYRFGRSRS